MKKIIALTAFSFLIGIWSFAQENEGHRKVAVPSSVKTALGKNFPESHNYHITWEKENGNYEANWGGNGGEANSAQFTPTGTFVEIVTEIPAKELPKAVSTYLGKHYKGAKLNDIGRALDATGRISYEVEIHGKDVIFDANGNFIKEEK
jgi:Putative beta-lactamase-inhibitor-like, PepSY-like